MNNETEIINSVVNNLSDKIEDDSFMWSAICCIIILVMTMGFLCISVQRFAEAASPTLTLLETLK